MNNILKKTLAILLVAVLLVGTLPGICFVANAATVNYQYGSVAGYGNIIKNWGTRGELATFLSPNAEAFYEEQGVSYEELSVQAGSSNVDQVVESELYEALYDLMSGAHTTITDYDDTKTMYALTDCQNNGKSSSYISGFYSGYALSPLWDGATWNREHTWPQSKSAGGNDIEDIMSIRPESSSINSSRGNKPYGESAAYFDPNTVSNNRYDVRGDVARVVLYTYVRWGYESNTISDNLWQVIESKEVLLDWIAEDPVDTWEMGRNDSVESITGTRNVFVDYPELAFTLFGESVPLIDTPSGNANYVSYTVSATTNNSAYGSVSVNHQYVTAHPNPGYRAAGYEVVSGNPTVTQNGNIFTVTASGNCAIRILFEENSVYQATFLQDGKQVLTQQAENGTYVVMPAYSGTLPEGYSFMGWVTEIVQNTDKKPTNLYPEGTEYVLQKDTTFYALVSWINTEVAGGITYELVTPSTQLSAGKKVVIAAATANVAMGPNSSNGNNRTTVNIVKGTNTLIFDANDNVQVLTLETGSISGSYLFNTGSGYLYATNNSSNYLKTQTAVVNGSCFNIKANSDGTCTITSAYYDSATAGVGKVPIKYNSANNLFSCYPKNTGAALALYVGVQGGTTYYTMAWTYDPQEPTEPETTEPTPTECLHANETTVEFEPSCTAQGYTQYYCADCGEYLYTDDYEDALGHTETVTPGYAATLTATGLSDGVHCSVCNEVLEKQQNIPCLASVDSWGLVLSDDLSVKFKIYVDASISANAKIHISMNGFTTTYETKALTAVGENYYYASVNVAAAQMGDTIAVHITNDTDSSEIKTYSVLEYATKMLADEKQSKYHALLKEMLNYGAAAQTFFDYKTDALVNENIEDAGAVTVPAAAAQNMTFTGSAEGISYYGASLVYREKLAVRFYFEGNVEGVVFASAGNPCDAVSKNNMYYAEVGGILPQNLDQSITLTATDAAGNTFKVIYSPMNYIVRMYAKGDDAQKNLMTALYNYHLAAKALTQA